MSAAIREAIESGDVEGLASLVAGDPALMDTDVRWGEGGKNAVPPLHFVCDAVFRGLVSQGDAKAMAGVLLDAGVDPDRVYARSGDTFLIAAASLGAEEVGLRLLEYGVDVRRRGLFRATALHWAAIMGLDRLAASLADAGAELDLEDDEYRCTPLQWAVHGWQEGTSGDRERIPATVRALVSRGASVPSGVEEALSGSRDEPLRQAFHG